MQRPLGVLIIAILSIIIGLLFLIPGLMLLAGSALLLTLLGGGPGGLEGDASTFFLLLGGIALIMGLITIPIGIGLLAVSIGLFKGKEWAWMGSIIMQGIAIALNITSMAIDRSPGNISTSLVFTIISGFIIFYLYMWSNVKEYFGKTASQQPALPPPPESAEDSDLAEDSATAADVE